jgi:hypothetical protein
MIRECLENGVELGCKSQTCKGIKEVLFIFVSQRSHNSNACLYSFSYSTLYLSLLLITKYFINLIKSNN